MKFRIDRDDLAEAVEWIARGLPARPSLPVLAGLLIEADRGTLTLSAFDYETSMRTTLPAEISLGGRALVSGRLLSDIVKALPRRPVDVEVVHQKVRVQCGSARFVLQTMPVEEYPRLPLMPTSAGTVKAESFAAAVRQARIAAGRDEILPILTGLHLELEGSEIVLVATDRYRATLCALPWSPQVLGFATSALVPARVLGETVRSFASGGDITVAVSSEKDRLIGFSGAAGTGTRCVTTRLLDGDFPRVRQAFDDRPGTVAYIATRDFTDAVKRVSLVAERHTPVRLSFSAQRLLLEAGSDDEAHASESIEATVTGADIATGFNPTYLLDALGVMSEPLVRFAFTDSAKRTTLSGVAGVGDDADVAFRCLVMPMRC